jgi:hypothetical protein
LGLRSDYGEIIDAASFLKALFLEFWPLMVREVAVPALTIWQILLPLALCQKDNLG